VSETVRFRLNGQPVSLDGAGDRTLLWALRGDLGLTGTKYGCGASFCGACTVLVAGRAVRSCVTTVAEVAGKDVVTIEGLGTAAALHPLQQAFLDHGAYQCGYCTPGMLLQAASLLAENPRPTGPEILAAMEDNLCRCGAHQRIVAAIEQAARALGEQP
jgi:aerobic-type carbon monoxide dehydrogenase small subunit (CoxS/CutS family)